MFNSLMKEYRESIKKPISIYNSLKRCQHVFVNSLISSSNTQFNRSNTNIVENLYVNLFYHHSILPVDEFFKIVKITSTSKTSNY